MILAPILSDYICLTPGRRGIPRGPIKLIQPVIYNVSPEFVRIRDMFGVK